MANSDPIMDSSPTSGMKRRKTGHTSSNGKAWDEENDSGDDLFEEHETVATLPLARNQQLSYSSQQLHDDLAPMSNTYGRTSSPATHITQPTQPLNAQSSMNGFVTQPTQPLKRKSPPTGEVQVERSSPIAPSSNTQRTMQAPPAPMRKAPFAKPSSMLASAMAPPGTAFRRPMGVQDKPKPTTINLDDSDEDPAVEYSSDEATQKGLKSNIRPTNFTKDGRGLNSSPNRVRDSPDADARPFASLVTGYAYTGSSSPGKPRADDMAGAYGGTSRAPKERPPQKQTGPSRAQPVEADSPYKNIDDIPDFRTKRDVTRMRNVMPSESVARCIDALNRRRGSFEDALSWLADHPVIDDNSEDELAPTPPVKSGPKGLARLVANASQSSQPVRSTARQDVQAPKQTIAERYAAASRKHNDSEQQRRRLTHKRPEDLPAPSPSPESSPPPKRPQPHQRARAGRAAITIDSDPEPEEDSGVVSDDEVEEVPQENVHETKLLKFFNESTVQNIVDTCTLPEADVAFVLEKRPFDSLDVIRTLTNAPTLTKSGKKSRVKPIGDKMVDACSEMLTGYDAVSDLVAECEQIAKPIKDTLKSWGVGDGAGELQLMNLEEAHDSGIGTPSSSHTDDAPTTKIKGQKFLGQPENMSPDIKLKDYQLVGLNWLNLLWSKKISCILADDMGLGKTCQVISFLSQLQLDEVDGVHLVIVPGSTLENWLREFQTFSPDLKVVPYYGSQLERPTLQQQIEDEFDTIDVIVTTYDMTVKPDDNKFLRNLGPSVCVYDEAHALRNPKSDRYKQLMRIPADFKILLTGTPLQNNLQELIAVLAFIMPDLFMQKKEDLDYIFQHKATTKDADHAALLSEERMAKARSMMTPFILRRKKQQVLWLPAKHSRVEYCDMTDTQANMYADELEAAQQVFADKAGGKKVVAKTSSNVLMNLRKAAIHPLLSRRVYDDKKLARIQTALLKHEEFRDNPPDRVWKFLVGEGPQKISGGDFGLNRFCEDRPYLSKYTFKNSEWMDCGKVQKFKELIQDYDKNGDRALVFSQFTTLMDILERVLTTLNIKFLRLDGSTPMDQRQSLLDEYYSRPEITVFMLSTKAGGAGINLAAANKVIIFDSGFNPQDDIQAENRAHRVGQTRDVEVVRLVSRGTIEEQIHALGESKLALDERVAGEGAGEDKAAEKEGEKAVEKMLAQNLAGKKEDGGDLKDEFKKGLESAGLKVA